MDNIFKKRQLKEIILMMDGVQYSIFWMFIIQQKRE